MNKMREIQNFIINNDIENAYNSIIENEKEYINNSVFWNLKGMLCAKIQEYKAAINCFKASIEIENTNSDAYYNIVYTYKLLGEKLKSVLYAGISLRYINDENFISDINDIYNDEVLVSKYKDLLQEIKLNKSVTLDNPDIVKYVAGQFNNIDKDYVELLSNSNVSKKWAYYKEEYLITNNGILDIKDSSIHGDLEKYDLLVLYNISYIEIVRSLAEKGIKKCYIIVPIKNNKFELVEINYEEMNHIKNKDYKRTITLNKFNAADSNVYSLIKFMPEKYKEKYKLNIINGRDVFNLENIVKVPLISSVTISGFNTFASYPKLTYNIDVGHGSISFKCAGLMDKLNKNFAFTPEEYENIDKVCITSNMNMLMLSSMAAIPENKYEMTGNPRTDTLLLSNGLENLERLIGRKISNKKIIFNMPTFATHENSGMVNGNKELNNCVKIKEFDYVEFNKFLGENNMICISKVHHAEEKTVSNNQSIDTLNNFIFISNADLDKNNLDLYEILNSADLLITDYSSIYGDFLFMNKPVIFINSDIEEYRNNRGLLLEPYDFWTAGPKVTTQEKLHQEIYDVMVCKKDEFLTKRNELKKLFYKYNDSNSSERVWKLINNILMENDN